MDVHDVLADGDLTATRWTMGGTARGESRGLPATGKTYVMTGTTMDKWADDRLGESWVNYDLLGALQQFGIISRTEPRAAEACDTRPALKRHSRRCRPHRAIEPC